MHVMLQMCFCKSTFVYDFYRDCKQQRDIKAEKDNSLKNKALDTSRDVGLNPIYPAKNKLRIGYKR